MSTRITGPVGATTAFDQRPTDYFSGTGYLGLQNHPDVLQAALLALQTYGLSTGTSRGGLGEHPVYDAFEQAACAFFSSTGVLYFASGYMGSAILTQATMRFFDHIFIDSDAHFSLWDAAQGSNLPITPFHHLQPQSLQNCLRRELRPSERPLILSDGVFPISGEIAPLPDYLSLAKSYGGKVYLDDAHALGVLGFSGQGTAQHFSISDSDCRTCGTLSKALGGNGGIIWGEKDWTDAIERGSRVCVGSSPPPLPAAAASAKALDLVRTHPEWLQQLRQNVRQARLGLYALGWDDLDPASPVPILCLRARGSISLERLETSLFKQGIAVTLVRNYTSTPPGGALRIAIFATHTPAQIERLIAEISRLIV